MSQHFFSKKSGQKEAQGSDWKMGEYGVDQKEHKLSNSNMHIRSASGGSIGKNKSPKFNQSEIKKLERIESQKFPSSSKLD